MDQDGILEVVSINMKMETIETKCTQPPHTENNCTQIQSNWDEVLRRIKTFRAWKRRDIDIQVAREYCNNEPVDDDHPFHDHIYSCARVNAAFIPHRLNQKFIKGSRTENDWAPYSWKNSAMKADIKKMLTCEVNQKAVVNIEGIEERLHNLEMRLRLKSKHNISDDIFTKLNQIEERSLQLEGFSPEYFAPRYPVEGYRECQQQSKDSSEETKEELNKTICKKLLIQVDSDEMHKRLAAVKVKGKAAKVRLNVQEYCHREPMEEDHPLWDQINTCARVDAVFVPHRGQRKRFSDALDNEVVKMDLNDSGVSNRIATKIENGERTESAGEIPNYKLDQWARRKVLLRIKALEDRISSLENLSPSYISFLDWTVDEIKQRIHQLETHLEQKRLKLY